MVAFGWLISSRALQVWQVIVFSFAAGCVQVFDTPARQALVLDIVTQETAPRALALNALGTQIVFALGAFASGMLIPLVGIARCYRLIAVAYGLSAGLVATLRVAQEHRILVPLPKPFNQYRLCTGWPPRDGALNFGTGRAPFLADQWHVDDRCRHDPPCPCAGLSLATRRSTNVALR